MGVLLFCASSWSKFVRFSISYCTCLGGKVGDSTEVIYPRPKRESMISIFTMWFMSIVKFHTNSRYFIVYSPVKMATSNIFIKFNLIRHKTVLIHLCLMYTIKICSKKNVLFLFPIYVPVLLIIKNCFIHLTFIISSHGRDLLCLHAFL